MDAGILQFRLGHVLSFQKPHHKNKNREENNYDGNRPADGLARVQTIIIINLRINCVDNGK